MSFEACEVWLELVLTLCHYSCNVLTLSEQKSYSINIDNNCLLA